jgi:hypothetical protein
MVCRKIMYFYWTIGYGYGWSRRYISCEMKNVILTLFVYLSYYGLPRSFHCGKTLNVAETSSYVVMDRCSITQKRCTIGNQTFHNDKNDT